MIDSAPPCSGEVLPTVVDDWTGHPVSTAPRPSHASTIINYGPWSPTCDLIERGRQLRCLSALALVYLGPGNPLWTTLRAAENDPAAFIRGQELIERVPSLPRRRLLATFSRLTWGAR